MASQEARKAAIARASELVASGVVKRAGVSRPEPDACAFGVPRAQCHNNCGYRCTRARRERAARLAREAELGLLPLATSSPSVAADHANCGSASCCRLCSTATNPEV